MDNGLTYSKEKQEKKAKSLAVDSESDASGEAVLV
jgi:hypothetical protein